MSSEQSSYHHSVRCGRYSANSVSAISPVTERGECWSRRRMALHGRCTEVHVALRRGQVPVRLTNGGGESRHIDFQP